MGDRVWTEWYEPNKLYLKKLSAKSKHFPHKKTSFIQSQNISKFVLKSRMCVWRRAICTVSTTEPKFGPREWIPVRIIFDVSYVVCLNELNNTHICAYTIHARTTKHIWTDSYSPTASCVCMRRFLVFDLYTWIWIKNTRIYARKEKWLIETCLVFVYLI